MKPAFTEYTAVQQQTLFDGQRVSPILPYSYKRDILAGSGASFAPSISVSGAQHKMSLVVRDGELRFAEPGEQGTHILKPHPARFSLNRDIPANEEFCMRVCRGIFRLPTAASALCFFHDGVPAYLTRRFDILPGGQKLHMEDLASLSGLLVQGNSNAKYNGSYEQLAGIVARVSSVPLMDLRLFFRMVLVNFILCNGDAHAKNFSMLEADGGAWRLAPVYDVMNTRVHVSDTDFAMGHGLFEDGRACPRNHLSDFFLSWGETIGLSRRIIQLDIRNILHHSSGIINGLTTSYMNPKARRTFLYHTKQRLERF
jgi:serine/threonine-protein kinase HipA